MPATDGSAKRPDDVAEALIQFYGIGFGGKRGGRYRVSRKYLRQITGRRRLGDDYLREVAEELFQRGFVLIDLETYFAILSQDLFNSYRSVSNRVVASVQLPESSDDAQG